MRISLKLTIAVFLCGLALVAAESSAKAEKEVMAAMEAWKQAMLHQDSAALEKLYHPDLTYSHSSGRTETKSEAIAGALKNKTQSIEMSDLKVRVYGNVALVKGKLAIGGAATKGQTNELNVLHVWMKTPQGWQMVARQATKLTAT